MAKVPQNPAFVYINTITQPKSNNSGVNEGVIKFWYKIRLLCSFVSIDSSLSAIVGKKVTAMFNPNDIFLFIFPSINEVVAYNSVIKVFESIF